MKNLIKKWTFHNPQFEFTTELPIESSAWSGHYFFAYDLISATKPSVIVELGTHKGNSLFSFAQAIKDFKLKTKLHGVDTWEGDKHAGFYGEEVFLSFLDIKDKYYKEVDLIPHRMYFDEAVMRFEDNSIDILHIDGLHTYKAVKHDFETWLPKMKKKTGIILLHDVCEKSKEFGVYKLWEELKKKYKTITFEHYHGLGVVFLNEKSLEEESPLKDILKPYYKSISKINKWEKEIKRQEKELGDKNIKKTEIYKKLNKEKDIIEEKTQEFEELQKSKVSKVLEISKSIIGTLSKKVSKLGRIIKRLFSYIIAFPRLLTEFPLKEIPLRTYVALRYIKYTEYNRDYQIYLRENTLDPDYYNKATEEISTFGKQPLISIIMPVYNVDLKWIKKAVNSVKEQIYTNWELCIADDASTVPKLKEYLKEVNGHSKIKVVFREKNGHISEASNTAISIAEGEYLALMDNDDEIHPQALYQIVKVINENSSVGLIYSDEDKMELNGTRCDPIFKSDYSPDYLLSTNYFCHLTTIRKDLVDKVGGFRKGYEGSQDYDLFLRVVEHLKEEEIIHIPDILYSWRKIPGSTALTYDQKGYAQKASFKALRDTIARRGIDGEISDGLQGGFFRIKYNIKEKPLTSIIVTTKSENKFLQKCINSIQKETSYKNYEIILVSSDKRTLILPKNKNLLSLLSKNYNVSAMRNLGVKNSKGEYIIFLDETLQVTNPKWIERLLEYAQRKNTGAVGPKIITQNKEVLGTSFWLDENNNIKNIHKSLPPHMQVRANLAANYTILSDSCFMISRKKYESVQGFGKQKDNTLSWIDFFLKLSEKELYNTYTPHLEVLSLLKRETKKIIKTDKVTGKQIQDRINSLERKLF